LNLKRNVTHSGYKRINDLEIRFSKRKGELPDIILQETKANPGHTPRWIQLPDSIFQLRALAHEINELALALETIRED
jgi:hypothetical protein